MRHHNDFLLHLAPVENVGFPDTACQHLAEPLPQRVGGIVEVLAETRREVFESREVDNGHLHTVKSGEIKFIDSVWNNQHHISDRHRPPNFVPEQVDNTNGTIDRRVCIATA